MWEIDYSEEYQSWFLNLDEAGKEAVFQRVYYSKNLDQILDDHMQTL